MIIRLLKALQPGESNVMCEVDPNYWTTGELFLERVQTRFERLGR